MKTKDLLLSLSIAFLLSVNLYAAPVGKQDAARVARNFFFEKMKEIKNLDYGTLSISDDYTVSDQDIILYYVFNFNEGGFIAVSATDNVNPVLCYSPAGKYSPDGQNPAFRDWMKQYKQQINDAIEQRALPDAEVTQRWAYYRDVTLQEMKSYSGREILPLLTGNWDQGKFYNEACPADPMGPGGHCYAGCVATALGQLMNYFRWPDTGVGSYSYECPPYGTLSADFGNSEYHWDLMEGNLQHSNPELAKLLFHIGVSVDMVYGPNGSGMYNHKGAYTLKTYFKYMPETQYVFRDSTTLDWDSLIVSHLDRRIPLYYAGWDVPNISGHAFICDGYQEGNYYHFNWGWNGSYNGYFYTDNLNPGGSNFNLAQELIINAVPDTNLYTYPPYCQDTTIYTNLFGTIEDGSGPIFPYQNNASASWLIMPNDSVDGIILTFDRFQTDTNDYVTVYDGEDDNAPILGSFSGDDIPPEVTSSGNMMFITFNSDSDTVGEGWLAEYASILPEYCQNNQSLTALSDTISDGSGSWEYHNNTTCHWMISPPGAGSVTLNFLDFETADSNDIVQIWDPVTQDLLATYSGSYAGGVPDPVTSPSGMMFIGFSTNYTDRGSGWTAYYETSLVGEKEFELSGKIKVYPNPGNGTFKLLLPNGMCGKTEISVYDLSGKKIYSENINTEERNKECEINLVGKDSGMYILKVTDSLKRNLYTKIFIQ